MRSFHEQRIQGKHFELGQFSMVAIVVTLLITAGLSAILFETFFNGKSGQTGVSSAPGVGSAQDIQVQTLLSTVQTDAYEASLAGGYGSISASNLQASDPNAIFTSGPSTLPNMVSVVSGGNGAGGVALPGGLGSSSGSNGTPTGSVTFAVFSESHTCWYIWDGSGGPYYGAQTGQTSCQAQLILNAPTPGPVSSSSIGWQTGTYPSA